MKLASLKDGGRDGRLVIVSRDLTYCTDARNIAPTLQAALDRWDEISPRLIALAESLGGVESLINHPASMTHASIPREERIKNGLSDSLIRLSVGVEDADDLIEDLNQAIG